MSRTNWMAFSLSILIVGTEMSLTAAGLCAEEPPEAAPAPADAPSSKAATADAPSTEAIAQWVGELGSDSFEVREAATQRLEQAGQPAIAPLTIAAGGDVLEVTARAIRILQTIYRTGNDKASEAAEVALEQLAAAPNRAAARRASVSLNSQDAVRQKRAIAKIQEMGGTVKVNETMRSLNGEAIVSQVWLTKDWKGGNAGMTQLKRLNGLSMLYVIAGANITPVEIEVLQKALPNLHIEHRGRAMLGVSGAPSEKGCQIMMIAKDSAAEKAGLEEGDIIIKFSGQDVKQFERVIEITKSFKPGDKVILDILRDEKPIRKEVILGEWK